MTDANAKPKIPSHIAALLRDEKWGDTSAKLTNYAHKRMGRRSFERAEEIAQEAITRLYDGDFRAWDPEKETLFLFLVSLVNSLANWDRVKASNNNEKRVTTKKMAREIRSMVSDEATPEDQIIAHDLEQRVWTKVRAEVANDRIARDLADLVEKGVDVPAEQAVAINEPIAEVRNARRRLLAHVETAVRSLTGETP